MLITFATVSGDGFGLHGQHLDNRMVKFEQLFKLSPLDHLQLRQWFGWQWLA